MIKRFGYFSESFKFEKLQMGASKGIILKE